MVRSYGVGKMQQLPSGKWRFMLPPSLTGRPKWSGAYATLKEADEQRRAALHLAAQGELVSDAALTLGEYGARWLAGCRHRTADDDRGRWRRFIAKRPIAAMALEDIKPGHIKRLMESVARTRKAVPTSGKRFAHKTTSQLVSPQTVRHVHGLMRRCFREAIVDGHISQNPCDGYRLPSDPERQRMAEPASYLSVEEIETLLSSSIPLRSRLIYEVAIYTGLRAGELWGLRWQDIDLKGPLPRCVVRHSFEGPTKNTRTRRFVLLPRAKAALLRWRDLTKHRAPSDLVFSGPRGRMHTDGYDAGWSKHRAELGLREGLTFHALRHTFASHLVMGSWGRQWQIHEVQAYIGHSSITVTQRYAHLSQDHLAELATTTACLPNKPRPQEPRIKKPRSKSRGPNNRQLEGG